MDVSKSIYKCNPKIVWNAKLNIILGSIATAALLAMPLFGKPLLPHVGIALVAIRPSQQTLEVIKANV